ncbi:cytochrome c oxidase subunit II [Halobiforma lacisalsi AJ5]|uniref:cytochrome-c oxidase n=1 Tax=Natronobacterium lacisalsi AJ5 TaxID=358396 RepID=M0LI64_NATLA|nr:cytochrome c oxidase subunit II [Halobiforma lacisalsi]APW99559.1 cytochrome c oxidase subunit II [Halobiforma lacisalsi AJ5]EMA31685.1 cytochrome c oxidase subunit II [Halobiforma lacisalsi AJ5]
MRRTHRAAVAAVLFGFTLAAVPIVAVAGSGSGSVTNQLIRRLNRQLLYLAVPIAVLVEVILLYTVWRFRSDRNGGEEPRPTRENRQLEITWTIATAIVLLFVGTASFHALAHPAVSTLPDGPHGGQEPGGAPEGAVEVNVTTEQWEYTFEYLDEDVTTDDELVLPANRPVYLYVTSEDVIHSVHVPGLGLKQDAVPGETHLIRTEPTETGEYRLYCAELCGEGHPEMLSTVRVVDEDGYESWLTERADGDAASDSDDESGTESTDGSDNESTDRVGGGP